MKSATKAGMARMLVALAAAMPATALTLAVDAQPSKSPLQPPSASPQPVAPQPASADLADRVAYSPWTKFCGKDQGDAQQTCFTVVEAQIAAGAFVASVAVIERDGEPKKLLRVMLPHGMLLGAGTRAIVDAGWPQFGRFVVCLANGCFADFEVREDFVGEMKKGRTLWLHAIDVHGQLRTYPLPLEKFADANAGPPTDPNAFAEQKRMQEQARAEATGAIGAAKPAAPK